MSTIGDLIENYAVLDGVIVYCGKQTTHYITNLVQNGKIMTQHIQEM